MSPVTLNRILLGMGFVGMFIAGVLTVQHGLQLQIPCGSTGGCEVVARHPSSLLFNIPVAYFGLAGYVFLTVLASVRGFLGQERSRGLVGIGYASSAFGMLYSLYLQYISFFEIKATCLWCLSSAILMTASFIVYTLYFNKISNDENVAAEPSDSRPSSYKELIALAVGAAMVPGLVWFTLRDAGKANIQIKVIKVEREEDLIPKVRNQMGPDNAVITLVEFADLSCPPCRESFPKVKELEEKYPGKIRVIFRHFPLYSIPGHEQSLLAAVTSEVAANKALFWQFTTAYMTTPEPPANPEQVYGIASQVGLDVNAVKKAVENGSSKETERLMRDIEVGKKIGVKSTPTFVMMITGRDTKLLSAGSLIEEMNSEEVQKLLK